PSLLFSPPGEDLAGDLEIAVERRFKKILQPAGEVEDGLFRRLVLLLQKAWVAVPANFNTAEQIGLGAGHTVNSRRIEFRMCAKDLGVGLEADAGAAPVMNFAKLLDRSESLAS